MDNNASMSKKKPDGHKPSRMARIKEPLARQIAELARRNSSSMGAEINRALREYLQREGLWPPQDAGR